MGLNENPNLYLKPRFESKFGASAQEWHPNCYTTLE